MQEYSENSYIRANYEDIQDSIELLQNIDFKVESTLVGHYEQYENEEKEAQKIVQDEEQEQEVQSLTKDPSNKSLKHQMSQKELENVQKDYQSYRDSVYQKQEQEENEDEEEEERQMMEETQYQPNNSKKSYHSGSSPNNSMNHSDSKQTYKTKSSKIDFDKFLEYKENRQSENQYFRQMYGGTPQDQQYDFMKQSEQKVEENTQQNEEQEGQYKEGYYTKKNSQHLYEMEYELICQTMKFRAQPEKTYTLQEQNNECFECKAKISQGLYILCNTANFCHYNQAFVCEKCISNEKRVLPWKILKEFDCKSYKISKQAKKEIDYLYDKCIIKFEYKDDIVKNNKEFYEFMILKRSLHLLYDMICNPYLALDLLQDKKNMVLKQNLFSLKNFYDFHTGTLQQTLERYYGLLQAHIEGCTKCLKSGFICKICHSQAKLFNYDIKNTVLCENCTSIYHRKCLENNNCFQCAVNY